MLFALNGIVGCFPADIDEINGIVLHLRRPEQVVFKVVGKGSNAVALQHLAHNDIVGIAGNDRACHLEGMQGIGLRTVIIGKAQGRPTSGREGIELSQGTVLHHHGATTDGDAVTKGIGELALL